MTVEKLTAADVAQRFQEGYEQVARSLHDYELVKAAFLCVIGGECLQVVRNAVEPLPDHDLVGRKNARAKAVKDIEALLPEVDGIGVPQVNRWIRWAGIAQVVGGELKNPLEALKSMKQAHLMVLEKFFDQHEPTAVFRVKEPWNAKQKELLDAVVSCIAEQTSAATLEMQIDMLAEFPPEKKEQPCAKASGEGPPTTTPTSPKAGSTTSPSSPSQPKSGTASTPPTGTSTSPSTASATPSASSPTSPAGSQPAKSAPSTSASGPSSQELANQAWKLLGKPEILAGVFRRDCDPNLLVAIVENVLRAAGEDNENMLALAKAYHKLKPVVLTNFEEYVDDGRFKLRKKDSPSVPTLEQLAPELATA